MQGYYSGNNPDNLTFVTGTLPQVRQWANYGQYTDITNYCDDLHKLKLTWSTEWDESGDTLTEDGISVKKTTSGQISIEGFAFDLLKKWLKDDVSSAYNAVEVMIEHVGCGRFIRWQITAKDIVYCENKICQFEVRLHQIDDAIKCIQRTVVNDNWQGWFSDVQNPAKKHPRFSYCNETRPNGIMIALWGVMTLFFFIFFILATIIVVIINIVIFVINLVISVINGIINFIQTLGFGQGWTQPNPINYISLSDILDGIANWYVESAGCGREHPAPLIRDYISNVCSKCGISVNGDTAPIFYAGSLTLVTSDKNRGQVTVNNPHYNACYMYAFRERGIRRFIDFSIITGQQNPSHQYWISDNAPDKALDVFLNELKALYNFEWEIRSVNNSGILTPTLFIKRKDLFREVGVPYLFDFSKNGADRHKIVEGICYEWNGKQSPARMKGLYLQDAMDSCASESLPYMNGKTIYFGNEDDNPTLKGEKDKTTIFGGTKFRLDGGSTDYIMDALQVFLWLGFTQLLVALFWQRIIDAFTAYADYALLLQGETFTAPKILIWDGQSYENAKAVKTLYATTNQGQTPQINPAYNSGQTWSQEHNPKTKVIGSAFGGLPFAAGRYLASDILTLFVYDRAARLVNYPMFFEPKFYDSMWDYFHWIDDPTRNSILNSNFRVKIELCCADMQRLKVYNDGSEIKLQAKVKVNGQYHVDAIITQVEADFDPEAEYGQTIELKGKL